MKTLQREIPVHTKPMSDTLATMLVTDDYVQSSLFSFPLNRAKIFIIMAKDFYKYSQFYVFK